MTSEAEGSSRDRFYVQKDKHQVFQQWGKDDASAPFETLKDVFIFAAAMGFHKSRRVPTTGPRQHVGFWRSFSSQEDVPLIQAIAVAETSDPSIVTRTGDMLEIIEEYANGGIDLLTPLDRNDRDDTIAAVASEIVDVARSLRRADD